MIVLDTSAVLALVQAEPGAGLVKSHLDGARLGTPNLAELVGKLVDADRDPRETVTLLEVAGVTFVPLSAADAVLAGSLRTIRGGRQLSLGDRCCLALASRWESAVVLTADRAWAELDLPVEITLIR